MKLTPTCPVGKYRSDMKIVCTKDNMLCAFQFFKQCKGWWANTESAAKCLKREEEQT